MNACSVEFPWPTERALPGRWIDGGSTYRGLRHDPGHAACSQTTRGGPVMDADVVIAVRIDDGLITGLYAVRNPEKLSRMERETTLRR